MQTRIHTTKRPKRSQQSNKHSPLVLRDKIVRLEHAVDDRDVCPGDLVHRDVARLVPLIRGVREEEQVAAVERGLHRAAAACMRSWVRGGGRFSEGEAGR